MRGGPSAATASAINCAVQVLLIAAASCGLFWLVWLYGNGLRDPRYLDGWVMVACMSLQVSFHVARRKLRLSPAALRSWRRLHILVGYLLCATFVLHCDLSLPDTAFEWVMWVGFVLVTLSGILGTWLAWSLQATYGLDEGIGFDRIPARRAELARDVRAVVADRDPTAASIDLPALPHDAWIVGLYTAHLRDFFHAQRNSIAHLVGSQRPLKRLTDEIDNLSRYVDHNARQKLAVIKALVVEKDRLDHAWVRLALSRAWLLVHVPITYMLIVLTVLHVIVVYAYSSGAW